MKIKNGIKFYSLLISALIQFDIQASLLSLENREIAVDSIGISSESFEKTLQPLSSLTFFFDSKLDGGGTETTFKLKDPSNRKWVLKFWAEKNRGISESLSRYLIDTLSGANSLADGYFVGEALPASVENCLPEPEKSYITKGAFFSIVPFIDGQTISPSKEQLENLFILTCFLSYFDALADNTLIDAKGTAHIIDTGSSFLYRSMGLKKEISDNWHPYYISEFQSMFKFQNIYTNGNIKSLDNISIDKKIASLKYLLGKGQLILLKADAFLRYAHSSDRIAILEMLSNRLYQIEIFYNHLTSQWNRSSRKYIQASNLDGAGFLSVAEHNGEKVILLGKRSTSTGTDTWCNLGGLADVGEFLHETAAREVFEESCGQIKVTSAASLPSHDLVSEKARGIYYRYRNYFHQTTWFDASSLHYEEYSSYAWVPIKDILDASSDVSKGYPLFEPFKKSLMQPEVRHWLESFVNNKPVKESHTQGFGGEETLKNTHVLYVFDNPSEQMAECAHEFIKNKSFKNNTCPSHVLTGSSISERFLRELANAHFIPVTEDTSILEILESVYAMRDKKPDLERVEIAKIKHAVLKSIEAEKNHPNHYAMYHGMTAELWLLFRTLSYIRYSLNGDVSLQTKVLRSLERFFDVLQSAKDVRNAISTEAIATDENLDALATTLSCNPTLFSNFAEWGEETLGFFSSNMNYNKPKQINNILNSLFLDLGIISDGTIFTKLENIKSTLNGSGAMLQFFIPKEADHLFYMAQAFGKPILTRAGQPLENNKEAMDSLANYDINYFHQLSLNKAQVRLHLNIANINGLEVIDYFANSAIDLEDIDRKIAEAIDPLLEVLGRKSILNTSAYRNPTLLQSTTRNLLDLSEKYDMAPEMSLSERAVLSSDLIALKNACKNDVTLIKNFTVTNPGDLTKINITQGELQALLQIDDRYLEKINLKNPRIKTILSMFEKRIDWFNYVNRVMAPSHERDEFILNYVFNSSIFTQKIASINFTDFYNAGQKEMLHKNSTIFKDFSRISEEKIKEVIRISNERNLTPKEKMAVLAAAHMNIEIDENLLDFIKNFSDTLDIWSMKDVLFKIFTSCTTLKRAKSLLKYFDTGHERYKSYSWVFDYYSSAEFTFKNINKINEKYVDFFNPFEEKTDLFNKYCALIEEIKDNVQPELVANLAQEMTIMNGTNEKKLLELIKECLSKESNNNHDLLLSMLKKKRASEHFFTPEITFQAYKNDITLEQYEVASLILANMACDEIASNILIPPNDFSIGGMVCYSRSNEPISQ